MTNLEYADALRQLAMLYEFNPLMAQPWQGGERSKILIFCYTKEIFAATIKAFGRGGKEDDGDSLIFNPEFPINFKVNAFKSNVCEARLVKRIIPETVVPARPATAAVTLPAREVEEVEYVCNPVFLEVQP